MIMIKLKSGETYRFQTDQQVKMTVKGFRQQGIKGNVYEVWGHNRFPTGSF